MTMNLPLLCMLSVMLSVISRTLQLTETEISFKQTTADLEKPIDKLFAEFKMKTNKVYKDDEEFFRRKIFEVNVNHIKDHNLLYAKGEMSYFLGVTQFTDMTQQEFQKLDTGPLEPFDKINSRRNFSTNLSPENILLPNSIDWRTKGYVTGVKNQQSCAAGWAFSTTGSLEGQTYMRTGKLVSLSEQQLVDCSNAYDNNGCLGGMTDKAFRYIGAFGLEGENDYNYTARRGNCHFDDRKVRANVFGYFVLQEGKENLLQAFVANVGPISVAIYASSKFMLYKGGVYNEPGCSSSISKINHKVLVVGYGTVSGNAYWLVKNSFGVLWGEAGYIRMSRNKNNQCGIANYPVYPLV